MKKNLLLSLGLFFGLAGANAQTTILYEDFEGQLPAADADTTQLGWYGFYNTPEFDERELSKNYSVTITVS